MGKSNKKVYIIHGKYGTDCFSNLSRLVKAYPVFTYHPLYDALKLAKEVQSEGYTIIKTEIK